MKRFFTLMAFLTAILLTINAQISVEQSGRSVFGKMPLVSYTPGTLSLPSIFPSPNIGDTTATIQIFHRFDNDKPAYLNIGSNCWIGQYTDNKNYMMLKSASGIKMMLSSITHFEVRNNGSEFFKSLTAPSFLTSSDARLKSNINALENNSAKLRMITPYSYILNNSLKQKNASSSIESENLNGNESISHQREQYGFLAQEVKEAFPNLVVEDENGWLSIDYIGFIPLLLDEVNKLQTKVEYLEDALKEEKSSDKYNNEFNSRLSLVPEASLFQNRPNPFTGYTEIPCIIPEESMEAYLYIYDLQGKQIRKIVCDDRGQIIISIDGNSLGAGMYLYALIIDGQEIDSKRMIITD